MTSAFINGLTVKRGDGATSEVFTTIPELASISNFGKTNSLVDVTNFDSTAREYIAGLSDGTEIDMEYNFLPGDATQQALITDVDNQTTRNLQIVITDGTTTKTYDFAVVCMSWALAPSFDDKNMLTFGLKITGAITVS
jgi:hypothetical protein